MPKNRQQKSETLEQIQADLDHKGVVFFSYGGIKVHELEELRKKLRVEASTITVAKRNLLLLALKEKGYDHTPIADALTGPVAVAVGDDEVTPAKIVADFQKTHEKMSLYGGLLENKFMDASAVTQLATLPSKKELLAKVVGTMNAPISGFVNVLAGNLRGLVNVVNAIKDSKAS